MSKQPSILILHASGTNRDQEAAFACSLAGGAAEIVHINQLRQEPARWRRYDMVVAPGGFSYGDALGAGVRLALDLQVFFADALNDFIEQGGFVLGICNGFQALVKAGALPGAPPPQTAMTAPGQRQVTLTENASGHFECRWVHLAVNPYVRADYLRAIDELIFCPVAHGEGNFQVKDAAALRQLDDQQLVAFRYVDSHGASAAGRYPLNPNGSISDIAGICNWRGNVVGLMPHPEDHIMPIQNPLGGAGHLGLALFRAMIAAL
jgi:phosphoribosylformylglycinamidine synthase